MPFRESPIRSQQQSLSKDDFRELKSDVLLLKNRKKTALNNYISFFEERFVKRLSIRKYAQAPGSDTRGEREDRDFCPGPLF